MLWKHANTQNKSSTNAPETRQAEALWRRIHERDEDAKVAAAANSAGAANEALERELVERELVELVELSGVMRDALDDAALHASLEIDAHEAFAPIHARLMDAIGASQTVASQTVASQMVSSKTGVANIVDFANASAHQPVAEAALSHRMASRFSLRRLLRSQTALRWGMAFVLAGAVGFGGRSLRRAPVAHELPVQSLVDDFDSDLRNPAPLEFVADDSQDERVMSRQLSQRMGVRVRVAATKKTGVRLLGARRHQVWNRPGVQSHYVKNGVQVALYQIREPRCSLSDLDEVEIGGRLYLTGARGAYHVVAWRSGDNVMTLVSPLKMNDALQLALTLRDPDASDERVS